MSGGVGWLGGLFLPPPNQGKIPVRFEWKTGKNSRIISPTLVVLVFSVLCLSQLCDINNR